MAAKKIAEETAGAVIAEPAVEPSANEPKYAVEKLRENSTVLFGVSRSTFDGAMYGYAKKEYTKKEAKAIIDECLYGKEGNE